ncbi:FtsP/CotA-like multicopper oxidase with cupredoxin domain [Rhodobacter sp. JA431]|uniref:multicopper oxidase family protein n=1 Tax=Rhodobacter sp. JA431 TaxID=570013 RepID=UPI000BD42C85|nr:multicopper oxidase family protein [Rhodobacter sp. JA431]SOC03591.1 FtsP/CotA-like multicopper oxidase with cupredoxin domain [Rhodobacter sp. JA431]
MQSFHLTRRAVLAGLGATALSARAGFADPAPIPLTAQRALAQIAPEGYPQTEIWSYDGRLPGPELRLAQGTRLQRRFVNSLEVPSSVHWHGIRIENAMDGVAGLTQEAVAPGASFDYDFVAPDAGTYWYHAHTHSMEQVARGLSGALIVQERDAPDVDRDEVLMFDDWLLDPQTAQIAPDFSHPMDLSHGGRFGNLIGTNGRFALTLRAKRHERLRLRLINAANARIFVLRLTGLSGWQVALDGMPLPAPEPIAQEIVLAPAQRIDLIVDVTAEGQEAAIERLGNDAQWSRQVGVQITGAASRSRRAPPAALPPNPKMDPPDLAQARPLEMKIEGGAMGRMPMSRMRGLMQSGKFWTLGGQAGPVDPPFARLFLGEPVRLRMVNDTAFPHAMHLHGMHFREVLEGERFGPMRDTLLTEAGASHEIAFTADNPGKWLLHCHMLAHAAAGMTSWIEVS